MKKVIFFIASFFMLLGLARFTAADCVVCVMQTQGSDECWQADDGYEGCIVYGGECYGLLPECAC